MIGAEITDIMYEMGKILREMKSIEHKSKLLREVFIPRKLQLATIYNKKPTKTLIRNTLPQRIRVNEKPMI